MSVLRRELASPPLPPELARRFETVARLLSDAAFDGELENLSCVLGGAGRAADSYRKALGELEDLLTASPGAAALHALRGKTLLNLGRSDEAEKAFDEALRLEPGLEPVLRWRAQGRIAAGAVDAARADLDLLEGEDLLLEGLGLAVAGKPVEAEGRWSELLRRAPASVAARALLGLSLAGRGLVAEADEAIEEAIRVGGRAPLLVGLRGLLARQGGRYEDGLRDFTEALELEPMPWLFSHRADLLNRMGFYKEALADLKKLSELSPAGPEPFVQAANILFDQGYFDEALRAGSRAIELAPSQPRFRIRRATLLTVCGRDADAVREFEEAMRLAPSDKSIELEWLSARVRIEPRRVLADLRGRPAGPRRAFLEGRCLARLGRYRAADAAFRRASKGEGELAERARLFSVVCRLLASPKPRSRSFSGLTLCGVGVRHPFQATVEVVRALREADTIFNNLPDPQVVEFLGLFKAAVRAVPRPLSGTDQERARDLLQGLGARESAAFVTRIHPFIYRRIGLELVEQARASRLPVRALGAVSLTELAVSLASKEGCGGTTAAWLALDIHEAIKRPARFGGPASVIVYCIGRGPERGEFARILSGIRPPAAKCRLLGGSGEREFESREVSVRGLGEALETADAGCVLVVPPPARPRRRRPQ